MRLKGICTKRLKGLHCIASPVCALVVKCLARIVSKVIHFAACTYYKKDPLPLPLMKFPIQPHISQIDNLQKDSLSCFIDIRTDY